jgi:hypothetical protein
MRHLLLAAGFLAALLPAPAVAQGQYDRYGDPVDVLLRDLTDSPTMYDGRAVRTSGQLELVNAVGNRVFMMRDVLGVGIGVIPVPDIEAMYEDEAMKMTGKKVEVVGLFRATAVSSAEFTTQGLRGYIYFWQLEGPPEESKKDVKADLVPLESLVGRPGRYDGRTIRIYGKFRGKNLYGDLPSRSQRDGRDWVLKDDVFSVWVTGRKPKGDGFELDAGLKRDTEKWIQVVGVPETLRGVTYVKAIKVVLGKPSEAQIADATGGPRPPAAAATSTDDGGPGLTVTAGGDPAPPAEKPKLPPMVVFALPLDGDIEVPSNGAFKIQFSKDMDESTFKGRVILRYPGPTRPGDRGFDGASVTYDGGRRVLNVDPGDVLRSGRVIEILLLPGIKDIDGLELAPRPGKDGIQPLGATDLLRYRTLAAGLLGAN